MFCVEKIKLNSMLKIENPLTNLYIYSRTVKSFIRILKYNSLGNKVD